MTARIVLVVATAFLAAGCSIARTGADGVTSYAPPKRIRPPADYACKDEYPQTPARAGHIVGGTPVALELCLPDINRACFTFNDIPFNDALREAFARMRQKQEVKLRFDVTPAGEVARIRLVSEKHDCLTSEAAGALSVWRFPATGRYWRDKDVAFAFGPAE